jgi:hypothetical protein
MHFVNRRDELAFLNRILTRRRPGPAQLILLYGRRRTGKTTLLRHWASASEAPYTYWTAEKEPAALQRRKLFAAVQEVPLRQAPLFESWGEVWGAVANLLGERRHILVLDELPYAAAGDPAMLSALQHAWDRHFKPSKLVIVLCGSQVQVMESLQTRQAPLYGRFTGQWHLQPLSFSDLRAFFPDWPVDERVALYGIVGGIPAYLEWLDPEQDLVENIKEVILAPGSLFLAEPEFLLYDEVREPQSYLAILKAIGAGNHTLSDISNHCLIGKSHLSSYLVRLQDLRLVERRLPATIPAAKRRRSRRGRYHLIDPYFRFYFRFLAPYHDTLTFDKTPILQKIRRELRAFIGQTTFEELARQWVVTQAHEGTLSFMPEVVGSHWDSRVQVDVVALNWQSHDILIGECKWGDAAVNRKVARDLVERKTPRLLRQLPGEGEGWTIHYALFGRREFTDAARELMEEYGGRLVDLTRLDTTVGR